MREPRSPGRRPRSKTSGRWRLRPWTPCWPPSSRGRSGDERHVRPLRPLSSGGRVPTLRRLPSAGRTGAPMSAPEERAAIRAFLLTLEGKNGLQIADAIEDYLAPYARRLEELTA